MTFGKAQKQDKPVSECARQLLCHPQHQSRHSPNCFPRLDILMQGHASPPITHTHTLPKQQSHHHIVSNAND